MALRLEPLHSNPDLIEDTIRLLEEGKGAEADKKKDEVEEKQRERRKEMAKREEEHIPRFFR